MVLVCEMDKLDRTARFSDCCFWQSGLISIVTCSFVICMLAMSRFSLQSKQFYGAHENVSRVVNLCKTCPGM